MPKLNLGPIRVCPKPPGSHETAKTSSAEPKLGDEKMDLDDVMIFLSSLGQPIFRKSNWTLYVMDLNPPFDTADTKRILQNAMLEFDWKTRYKTVSKKKISELYILIKNLTPIEQELIGQPFYEPEELLEVLENALESIPKTKGSIRLRNSVNPSGNKYIWLIVNLLLIFDTYQGTVEFSPDQRSQKVYLNPENPFTKFEEFIHLIIITMEKHGIKTPQLSTMRKLYINRAIEAWSKDTVKHRGKGRPKTRSTEQTDAGSAPLQANEPNRPKE